MFAFCLSITMLPLMLVHTKSDDIQMYYRKVFKANGLLHSAEVISSLQVLTVIGCSLHCLRKSECSGFNYREKNGKYAINCQLSKGVLERIKDKIAPGEWTYYAIIDKINNAAKKNTSAPLEQNVTTCTAFRKKYPGLPSGIYYINPQNFSSASFPIFCDMNSKNGVGVTVIAHDSEKRTKVDGYEEEGSYKRDVTYEITLERVVAIINQSKNCEQFIKYECRHAFLLFKSHSWWVSRQGKKMNYWGGAVVDSGKCACGINNSYVGGGICNCYANDGVLHEDSGFLNDRNTLPVTQLRFGDTGSYTEYGFHTLGKLICWG